ncbi:MAG: DUF2244 domain-containing protein [Pseudomonadota bacterium]
MKAYMVIAQHGQNKTKITLKPNRSLDWDRVKPWLVILSLPTAIIAFGWLLAGVWIILPFAGLEIALLSYFMYKVCYMNYRCEEIVIERDKVTVQAGINSPKICYEFSRPDCYLVVNKPNKPIDNLHLTVKNTSNSVTIGEFLSPSDKETARKEIISAGLIECSNLWWKNR